MRSFQFSVLILLSISFSALFVASCTSKSMDGMVILSRTAEMTSDADAGTGKNMQVQIVAINPEKPDEPVKLLTEDFYSAQSPEVSFDGKHLLFSAQLMQNDPWQIWEMNLEDLKTTQITSSPASCTDPAYLPLGQVVFSKTEENDSLKAGKTLFTCNLDGTNLRRVTFNPHEYFASSVLKDGRVITITRQVFPSLGKPLVMALRPDGTKSEFFYKSREGTEITSRAHETDDGKILFIEKDSSDHKMNIISLNYNRPLHSYLNLTSGISGNFYNAYPLHPGKLMVCYKSSENDRVSLFEFNTEDGSLGQPVYKSNEYDVLEAVVVGEHERPRKLPSEVDMGVKTGQLLCQDINVTNIITGGKLPLQKADRIEIIGIDSSLGVVRVEEDGSFYLKVAADIPFTLKTMDADGKVINGPGSWIWLRPNERRGCVGCHEDHEMVPANILPLAVKSLPVSVPIHVSVVKEKEVELE